MKRWLVGLASTLLVAYAGAAAGTHFPTASRSMPLKDHGPAPELTNTVWLNTASPLRLADLRGKVTLIDMWTFG